MKKKKSVPRWLQIVSTIIANAAIVLSIIYIVFYILDGFNPMLHFLGEQVFVTRYLDVIIAGIADCRVFTATIWRSTPARRATTIR